MMRIIFNLKFYIEMKINMMGIFCMLYLYSIFWDLIKIVFWDFLYWKMMNKDLNLIYN